MSDQDQEAVHDSSAVGSFLAGLRRGRRLSGAELGRRVSISQAKISKIESGATAARPADAMKIADALEVTDEERQQLVGLLAAQPSRASRWKTLDSTRRAQRDILRLEAEAVEFREFYVSVAPGLLQTAGYASSLLRDYTRPFETVHDAAVANAVTQRVARQEILVDLGRRFWFVIAEVALQHRMASPAVMLAQVERLRSAAEQPNIELCVLRSDAPLHYPPLHDFVLLDDNVSIVDTMTTTVVSREAADLAVYRRVFEYFWEQGTEEVGPILDRYARIYADLARPAD